MTQRIFPGVRPPSIDFQAVRDGRRSRPLYLTIALDTARSLANGITTDSTDTSGKALQIAAAANSFFSDPIYDSSGNYIAGVVVAHFEDTALGAGVSTPNTILPNSAARIPFTTVILENFAQAGKKARLIFGVDIDFVPGFNSQSTISGIVSTREYGLAYGASFKSVTALGIGATEQVFAAATNVNGAIVWAGDIWTDNGAGINSCSLHAHTVAPAAFTDGDVLLAAATQLATVAGQITVSAPLPRPVFVPAGKGLWFLNLTTAEGGAVRRRLLYTLL